MYEMYPDAWTATVDQRQSSTAGDKPRRRVRREHSVIPPVIAQQLEARAENSAA